MASLLRAALVAAVTLLALGGAAVGDGPEAGRFPYGELALLGAAEAAVRVVVREAAAVRLRPAGDWSAVAEVEAGDALVAAAVTPGRDPWVRVVLPGGSTGWMRAANVDAPEAAFGRLPAQTAAPIRVRAQAGPEAAYARPGGGPLVFELAGGGETYAVFGRSVDGAWLAIATGVEQPTRAWVRAALLEDGPSSELLEHLPIFVGRGTVTARTLDESGSTFMSAPPASVWQWTADGRLAGVEEEQIWQLDPELGTVTRDAPPTGGGFFSPDGRYVVATVPRLAASGNVGRQQYLIAVDGSRVVAFPDVFWYPQGGRGAYKYGPWSPDGRWLVVVGVRALDDVWVGRTAVSVDGEIHALSGLGGDVPVWLNAQALASLRDGQLRISTPRGEVVQSIALPDGSAWNIVPQPGASVVWINMRSAGWHAVNYATGSVSKIEAMSDRNPYVQIVWSPNGSHALVLERGERPAVYHDQFGTLRTLADASEQQIDGRAPYRGSLAAWSPNSSEFILQTSRESIGLFKLTQSEAGEPSVELVRTITTRGRFALWCEGHDQWSPDGEHFAVYQHEAADVGPYGRDGLAVMDSLLYDFAIPRLLIFNREGQLERSYRSFARSLLEWSPDGRWLAFGRYFGRGCPLYTT